ncbi:DUF5060 domain-containing protein [Flexithrix dorotheae]|uniref:DUF5060 domain-containing protein n=1 Tax=Flexithrix dorotheae TaxID=70993 RepID=UPI00037A088F|nr:DUF5060 domain-containing protein [Flexithrix dorotheae]
MKLIYLFSLLSILCFACQEKQPMDEIPMLEIKEVVLKSEGQYDNPYTEVECWLELEGPDFKKKIYGFWNGDNEFVFRLVAISPGEWKWKSFSNQDDKGLNNHEGGFKALPLSDEAINLNPNNRGFIRSTTNGRALEYADGTPFFMLADTWWAASTWRFPLKGITPSADYVPKEGISFEEALSFRKKQGYNTIAMIAAYPNWKADEYPAQFINADSVGVRQAWEKNGIDRGKDMHDENGNMPFEAWEKSPIIANYDRLNPEYFKSLDKKMKYLKKEGFVTFLETVRRDHGPSWKKYFDFKESYARYVQYIVARYGAFNIIFSGIHLDWINENFCLPPDDFNEVLTYHYNKYGGLPYGQPHSILIDGSTYTHFGHGESAPWLNMHAVGNVPRNHGFYPMIEEIFALNSPYPVANLEPYYPGWDNVFHNLVAGERPVPNSDRDNYFGRTQMYGSVLSGGLAGHVYGTGAYCGSTTGEPRNEGERPSIWEGLNYPSGAQLPYLAKFILSEGIAYQQCEPKKELLIPHKAKNAPEKGLDGWSFLLLHQDAQLGFLYFENQSEIPQVTGLNPNGNYELTWFDPISGEWLEKFVIKADEQGQIQLVSFPDETKISTRDWALKLKVKKI